MRRHNVKPTLKGQGFQQPLRPHEHRHVDASRINLSGTFFYLRSLLDGCSRSVVRREIREFDHFLRMHHYEAAMTGDRRVLKRYDPIIERLAREEAEVEQAVLDRRALSGSTPAWLIDEIAAADRETRVQEFE